MRRASILLIVIAFLAPSSSAHLPPGPKTFCETSADKSTHDYQTDQGGSSQLDGSLGCGSPLGKDGHLEYGPTGGVFLAADSGGVYGGASPWTGASWGSVACLGEVADHAPMATIMIIDVATGGKVGLSITADYARDAMAPSRGTICGDNLLEPCDPADPTLVDQLTCNAKDGAMYVGPTNGAFNSGTPSFGPGQNGAYLVFALSSANPANPGLATAGHIISS